MQINNTLDNRDWVIYRDKYGKPRWWQRFYESYLVMCGKHSLHRAWQKGFNLGSHAEYVRLITNKGYICEVGQSPVATTKA